jgi:site-specific DNA-methyltransferase (adenine-specific)
MDNRYKTIIVMLIPSRTDTRYWHNYIFNCPYASIKFLKGRIKFVMDGEMQQSAPFPSAIVVFDNINKQKSKILY